MKILHIVPSYIPAYRYGGPIQSVHGLNKWLVKQGAEVVVYTTSVDGPENMTVPLGVPTDMNGVRVYYFKPGFLRFWLYSAEMRKVLGKNLKDFDIVHITSVFLFASALGAHYAKKYGKPYIISPRGNFMKAPMSVSSLKKKIYTNIIERRNLAGAAAIHFTSEEEKNDYLSGGFPAKKSLVIPNGTDLPAEAGTLAEEAAGFRKKHGIPPEAKVVSCLGRVSWIKGFDVLVPALKLLKDAGENTRLLVIGGDDNKGYLGEVKKMVEEKGLKDRVIFAGMLAGREKSVALAASDLLVQPSESESFGMAVAEAMAAGLPVIVAKGVGLAKLILETDSGIVISKNSEELAGAVKKITRDGRVAGEMGRNGREVAKKYLSNENVANRFIAEYNAIVEDYGKNK